MESNRRSFLKISGICALGLGALPVVDVLAKAQAPQFQTNPGALTAKKWGMVVDMKKCWEKGKAGCQDCILACHHVHNVPDIGNIKEEVKWIWEEPYPNAFPGQENEYNTENVKDKQFIVLCNHCTNPPCVRVCPTKATFKRADGIVMMDMHRCIGCRFCMAGCPYGSRSFNFRDPEPYIDEKYLNRDYPRRERGVVEKCTFCTERLAVGKLPACVEACKVGALTFGDLDDPKSAVRKLLATHFTIQRKPELGTGPNVYYIV
jgi:Fe-S-cluster-containing dehydrogenase component